MRAAKLRVNACVEDIDYRATRGLDKTAVRALTQVSAWVRNHENIFVLGPPILMTSQMPVARWHEQIGDPQ